MKTFWIILGIVLFLLIAAWAVHYFYKQSLIDQIYKNHSNTDADRGKLEKLSISELEAIVPASVH